MPTLADIAAITSLPVLSVRVPGRFEQSYILQSGMTIGRSSSCAIVVDHCDICSSHARIIDADEDGRLRIVSLQRFFALSLAGGCELMEIVLANGTEFSIGEVRFGFRELAVRVQFELPGELARDSSLPRQVLPIAPPLRLMCPRCHEMLLRVPASAKFCPKCGLDLPENCPLWPADGVVEAMNPALIAYANALFNLGLKFENVAGGWDLQQARRYFEKAARFGITPAKARLEAR